LDRLVVSSDGNIEEDEPLVQMDAMRSESKVHKGH
jgi:hypothetical protein